MSIELGANAPTLQAAAAIPILLFGLYVLKSNTKELTNRVFGLMCLLWTLQIVAFNLVRLSSDEATALQWSRIAIYATILFVPTLVHFALVFPYHSRLLRFRLLVPALYLASGAALALLVLRESTVLRGVLFFEEGQHYVAEFSLALDLALGLGFTTTILFLVLRYTFTDLEVTRKRLFFVTFAIATYAFYENGIHFWLALDDPFQATLGPLDQTFWQLTLASDLLLYLVFFTLLGLTGFRAADMARRNESFVLMGAAVVALIAGILDPALELILSQYTGVLWLWRIAAVALMWYAILRYQLFDLHVRIRLGVKYGTMTTVFAAVFFTVQEIVKDLGGDALGYFAGLLAAAALTFLFQPVQTLIERFSHKVVPPTSTENYEKYRTMEIYRAALEGALADKVVSPAELHSLTNLREKLGISDADHALLERDIRAAMEKRLA